MKKPQCISAVLLSSFLAIAILSGCQIGPATESNSVNQESPGTIGITPTLPSEIQSPDFGTLSDKTSDSIHEETANLIVDAVYPITGNTAVDQILHDFTQKEVDYFKKDAPEIPADSTYQQNSIYISFTRSKLFGEDQFQSFKFDISVYTGGAHPNTLAQTMTFNMETGKPIQLADIFNADSNYLKKLSTLSRESLNLQMPEADQQMLNAGTEPTSDNFANWTFDDNKLVLHFDPYQVAPYAAGPQSVSLKLSDLSNIVIADFAKPNPPTIPSKLTPSRATTANCFWKEFEDAKNLGLRMLIESCANGPYFGIRKGIIVTHFGSQKLALEKLPDDKFNNVVEIFSKPINQSPEEAIQTQFISKLSALEQKECRVQESPENSHSGVRAYIIQPSEQYMHDSFGSQNSEEVPALCGNYGMANGLQYFEFQDFNAEKFVFLRIGVEMAPFDEKNIYILPQTPTNTTVTTPKVSITDL